MSARPPKDRPIMKLSVSLIETYKQINRSYYEERDSKRVSKKHTSSLQGPNNNGWDDENFDYILTNGEIINGRYMIKEKIGKGSFGQVARAIDTITNKEVAIKIIKSKKPFIVQSRTEIELLSSLSANAEQNNIVRLLAHFMYRHHQCLVFEMLSLNLYELLKNTQFNGVSLILIRKFAKQILKSLSFLKKPDINIIHCDLKPENILLRHPKRSGVKIIDFGSSCKSNKRMYSYIQSRFYRAPEILMGLPYTAAIDIWSLACILVEMHTGEPLFSGSDQIDQMHKIVSILGMIPSTMMEKTNEKNRTQYFGKDDIGWYLKKKKGNNNTRKQRIVHPDDIDTKNALSEIIIEESKKKKQNMHNEPEHSSYNYGLFIDMIEKMLKYDPSNRLTPDEALKHPFIIEGDMIRSSSRPNVRRSRRS